MGSRHMILAGTATLIWAIPAMAQSTSDEQAEGTARSAAIDDIIVTAQKREQNVQDVPISITAIGSEAIEQNRITNVRDLDSIAPNLQVKTGAGGSNAPQFTMRGAVGIGTAPGADKGIAVYLDGVFLGSSAGQIFDVADIQRIEVLRGPQGTLFGRNSSAGAISIVSSDPRGEFHFKQKVDVGNYAQLRTQTRIDTPSFGHLSAAFTYTHIERRGDIRNLGGGTTWDFSRVAGLANSAIRSPNYLGGRNSETVAVAVKLEPSDDFSMTYKFDHSDATFTPEGVGLLALNFQGAFGASLGAAVQAAYQASPNVSGISPERPDAVNNWFTTPSHTVGDGHNLTIVGKMSDRWTLKNIMGYRRSRFTVPGTNFDGLGGIIASPALLGTLYGSVPQPTRAALIAANTGAPFLVVTATAEGRDEQLSEELQLNYESDSLTLILGGMYYWAKTLRGGFGTAAPALNVTPVPNFVIPNANAADTVIQTESYATFAQAEFHLTPTLNVVGGVRLTHDRKYGIDRAVPTAPIPFTFSDTRPTYMVGINWQPTASVIAYAKYSTGFISGGQLGFRYDPETSQSWEAGIKADWLDRRVRTNLALFYVDYKDLQSPNSGRTFAAIRPDLVNATQVLANVGDARAYGFELEATVKPIPQITLGANLGYTDFKYTQLRAELATVGATGVHNRPKWTNTYSAQFDSDPIWGDAYLTLRVNATQRSDQLLTSTMAPFRPQAYVDAARTGEVWLVDARATISDINVGGSEFDISLWGRNLFDNKAPNYGADLVSAMTTKYELARTYGVEVTFQF